MASDMTPPDPQRVERDTRASLIEEMQKAFRVRTIFDSRIANDIFDRIAALSAADAIQPTRRDEVLPDEARLRTALEHISGSAALYGKFSAHGHSHCAAVAGAALATTTDDAGGANA